MKPASFTATWKRRFFILRRMGAAFFFKRLGRWNTRLQGKKLFFIKEGYHHAVTVEPFDDTPNKDEWQRQVYELAATLARSLQNPHIVDVGCGSAYKLIHLLGNYSILGIEVEPTLTWLKNNYPAHTWKDFEAIEPASLKTDILICADVIEHMEDPDTMMDFLADIDFQYLILSTPERDAKSGKNDYGPPVNTAHYREWSAPEFRNYVRQWFHIQEHHIFDDKSITQAAVCLKKQIV